MKWQLELIANLTLVIQLTLIYFAWQFLLLTDDSTLVFTALAILITGLIGATFVHLASYTHDHESSKIETFIRITGATVATICIFVLFLPIWSILSHSITASVAFLCGIIVPWVPLNVYNYKRQV